MGTLPSHFQMPALQMRQALGAQKGQNSGPCPPGSLGPALPHSHSLFLTWGGMEEAPWLAWRSLSVYSSLGSQLFPFLINWS